MSRKQAVFIDLGALGPTCSSLQVAELYAMATGQRAFFVTSSANLSRLPSRELIKFVAFENVETQIDYFSDCLVVDFTRPGQGVHQTALLFQESYNFYLQQDLSYSHNSFSEKVEYVESVSFVNGLLKNLKIATQTPVLTYSADYAALLNLQGIPSIELCYRFKHPGSFLPTSVVIFGDTFSLLRKDEIQLIFEFYQNGKMEDLFMGKNVLEVDWDVLYFKMDKSQGSIVPLKHPVSTTEAFLDHFLKSFLTQPSMRAFSIESALESAMKLDVIDLEMTLDFLRKVLSRCMVDLDKKQYPLTQSHWNWVRPYADCYSKNKTSDLRHSLNQALLGLDLFLSVQERQKKVIGMH
jgi:hypothetical protein